mgnify:CR=1 FL=1
MPEFQRPTTEQEFHENFAQIKPLMSDTEAHHESSRCLFCYDAPCVHACPTGIDIPLFIRLINSGNTMASASAIFKANYLGHACGQVCPTEVLCEGACVYQNDDIRPVDIGRLQAYATRKAIERDVSSFEVGESNGKKTAIIGAGPAGISCACELRREGYDVEIFEANELPSGLTVHGVAPYKITNEAVLEEVNYLERQFGFRIHYNSPILNKTDFKKLENDYDAIFLGIGLGETRSLKLPGEDLENCFGAVEFIEQLRLTREKVWVGKKVIVLGGGNTAMDAASESARLGADEVFLCYRRSKGEMGAYEFEYDLAKSVGAQGVFNVAPLEILGGKRVEGVRFVRTVSNNGKLENVEDSEFVEPCDMVIRATGQLKKADLLRQIDGLKIDDAGRIIVDPASGQTGNPKYFAAGDAVNGGKEVVNAVAEGKIAARGIHAFLTHV